MDSSCEIAALDSGKKNIDLKIGIKQELEQRSFFTHLLFVYHKADVTPYAQVFKAFRTGLKRCTLVHQRMRHHKHKKEAELFRARCNATLSHPGDGAIDCIFFFVVVVVVVVLFHCQEQSRNAEPILHFPVPVQKVQTQTKRSLLFRIKKARKEPVNPMTKQLRQGVSHIRQVTLGVEQEF